MRKILTVTAFALALAGASLGAAGTANAARVGFNIGNVSLGFSDGYWDNGHHWHRWAHRDDAARFRAAHAEMYHEWRHDDRHHH
jgi:hypothetical protein